MTTWHQRFARTRFSRHWWTVPVIALAAFAIGAGSLQAPAYAQRDVRSVVGFNSALTDDDVVAFIGRYGLTVGAVYLASSGFTGTQRAYVTLSPRDLVQSARDDAIDTFTKALDGNLFRIDRFLKEYDEDAVTVDAALATKARGLLTIRSQIQAVIDAARRGEALIYGLEVRSADSAKLVLSAPTHGSAVFRQTTV